MKSVGEVMSIGRSFEEAIQKAVQVVKDNDLAGPETDVASFSEREMEKPTIERICAIVNGMANGKSADGIHKLSMVEKRFLFKLGSIVRFQEKLASAAGEISLDVLGS